MEFDKSKVYTALNADESLIGAKGYFADKVIDLRILVEKESDIGIIKNVGENGFDIGEYNDWNFFYLVEPAHEEVCVVKAVVDGRIEYQIVDKEYAKHFNAIHFKGTDKECNQYILEHSKPKHRPFKDTDELIDTYNLEFKSIHNPVEFLRELPTIWVKDLSGKARFMITCFGDNGVSLNGGSFIYLDRLYNQYTFLDGSPCGVEE